jgi:uncharacterized membrane protein
MSILDITDNEKRDKQLYMVDKPSSDFSPRRNKHIVEKTIKEYEERRKQNFRSYFEQVAERVDAAMSFVRHLERSGYNDAEKYFGKKELARLRGQKILKKIHRGLKGEQVITLDEL